MSVLAIATSATGIVLLLGNGMISMEVAVQREEASLRKWLVGAEIESSNPDEFCSSLRKASNAIPSLGRRMADLFFCSFRVQFFLSIFSEFTSVAPYWVAAPLLFASGQRRITLGKLVKLSNSFDRIVHALSIFAENFGEINAFLAVRRRLREFERGRSDTVSLVTETRGTEVVGT
jgi:ABC-type long-subunit fatty acid transport system fused permease/ATPase subunit